MRQAAHALGFRFRLHRKDLPGKPDLVFPKHRLALFVHGCFWHRHPNCSKASIPKTRSEFWGTKFDTNIQRDERVAGQLEELGWRVETIWECETKNELLVKQRLHQAILRVQSVENDQSIADEKFVDRLE